MKITEKKLDAAMETRENVEMPAIVLDYSVKRATFIAGRELTAREQNGLARLRR